MALARLCLKITPLRPSPSLFHTARATGAVGLRGVHGQSLPTVACYSSTAATSGSEGQGGAEKGDSKEMTASEGSLLRSPSRRRRRGTRGLLPWRNPLNLVPSRLGDGLENALIQASENLSRLLENWNPARLLGRMKEDDKCYKLKFVVPGVSKEDLKITVEGRFLVINGEHKDEEENPEEEDGWYLRSAGYYNTSILLPDDAKVEETKAELKDGILNITIPRSEVEKKEVKEVEIQ